MKPALLILLSICAGVSVAHAALPTPPRPPRVWSPPPPPPPPPPRHHSVPEMDWGMAGSALIVLAGTIAIVRGRRVA